MNQRFLGALMMVLPTAVLHTPPALHATSVLQATSAAEIGGCAGTVPERVVAANPSNYRSLLNTLGPGDLLQLEAGTYTEGLPFFDHHGEPDRCIIVEGPENGGAVFMGRDCCNTVSLTDSSYLVIRNLELDGDGRWGDAVKAESPSTAVHHITLENLSISNHDRDQQVVGINTKCPTWNWVIRRNVITSTGTGIYLGNSDGEDEFVNGLVEYNVIYDTVGYNMQVKHQNGRSTGAGMPASGDTVIRHNVFSKAQGGSSGGNARPNLLIGHRPLNGNGANDNTLIYGNFFYQNPNEGLFQGEGHVIFYNNLLVNDFGAAVRIQAHNDVPKRVRVFYNTIVATGTTVSISSGDAGFEQRLAGNALFGNSPSGGVQVDNASFSYASAGTYLNNPDGVLTGAADRLDLAPLASLQGTVDSTNIAGFEDGGVDFDGNPRSTSYRGAYATGTAGWLLSLEIKPEAMSSLIFGDGFESGSLTAWSGASIH